MIIFRRSYPNDLEQMYEVAQHSGYGITTLPKEKELLQERLSWSCSSFDKAVKKPVNEYYFFVLEDLEQKKLVGTSAIEASIGHSTPFYSYKLSKRTRICHSLNIRSDYTVLSLVNDYQGYSELCTLYLEPSYRVHGNGLLLSRARFLFMAHYPNRFAANIIADMRGISDESGRAPLWESLGRHFFQMPFPKADELTLSTNKQFIADLMPRNPVYVSLLPKKAQMVIGKPHTTTIAAMNILLREGFRYNKYVDIFDGGPTIEAPCDQIKTIQSSRLFTVGNVSDEVSSARYLVANTRLEFRAVIGQLILNTKKESCIISKDTAEALEVKRGDCIRLSLLHHDNPPAQEGKP